MASKKRSKSAFAAKFTLETLETRETPAVFATVSAVGSPASVVIKDTATFATSATVSPFGGFTGGIQVALADVNADGTDDVVVASGAGGSANLEIYNGVSGALIRTQSLGTVDTSAGVSIAAAGKNAAGEALVIVGAVLNGSATVQLLNLTKQTTIISTTPFGGYDGALSVAAADVNGDAVVDLIVGPGFGGGPRLAVINGKTGDRLFDGFVFESFFNGGINVSAGDVNGDGKAEVIVGAGVRGGPRVRILQSSDWTSTQDFFAYDSGNRNGVSAAPYAAAAGGATQIITRNGPGSSDGLKAFNPTTAASTDVTALTGLPAAPIASTVASPTGIRDNEGMVGVVPDSTSSSFIAQSNGVKIWDTADGSGTATVTSDSTLSVYYTGWLLNGTSFDSSRAPATPANFPLTNLIQGWQTGLIGAKVGTVRRLFIPAALAYGASGQGSIPANADLIFEIKIKGIS